MSFVRTASGLSLLSALCLIGVAPLLAADGWVLRGTLLSDPGPHAAIFQDPVSGEQHRYRQGSYLPSGAYLAAVRRHSVVVHGPDGEQSLRFGARLAVAPGRSRAIPVPRAIIQDAVDDLPSLVRQVRIAPHRENGRVTGYAIRHLEVGGLGERLGFKRGDVLTRVNGIAVDESANGWDLYSRLKDEGQISVDLVRGGSPLTVSFRLQ